MEKHLLPTSVRRMECVSVFASASDCSESLDSACESHDLHLLTEILNCRRPSKKTEKPSCRCQYRCVDARRGALPTTWDILSDVDSTGDQRPGASARADTEERRVLRGSPIARWQVCLESRSRGIRWRDVCNIPQKTAKESHSFSEEDRGHSRQCPFSSRQVAQGMAGVVPGIFCARLPAAIQSGIEYHRTHMETHTQTLHPQSILRHAQGGDHCRRNTVSTMVITQ